MRNIQVCREMSCWEILFPQLGEEAQSTIEYSKGGIGNLRESEGVKVLFRTLVFKYLFNYSLKDI